MTILIGDRCRECGEPLLAQPYIKVLFRGRTVRESAKPVCLDCLGELLLENPKFISKLCERLLKAVQAETPSEG